MATYYSQLDLLARAKERKVQWIEIADALNTLEATSGRAPDGRTWTSFASQASGISENQLRRFTRTRAFMDEAEAQRGGSAQRLRLLPFAHVEALSKIGKLDPSRAIELIHHPPDHVTYLDLLKEYQHIRSEDRARASPVAAGKHAAQEFIRACGRLINSTTTLLPERATSGRSRILYRPIVGFDYTNPDYVIRDASEPADSDLEAVDCYLLSGNTRSDTLTKKIVQVAFESTFFTRFWCLIPPSDLAERIILACTDLRLLNVGLVIVDIAKQSLSIIRNPKSGPVPDRTGIIRSSYGCKRLREFE
jgi:hypothetical protein